MDDQGYNAQEQETDVTLVRTVSGTEEKARRKEGRSKATRALRRKRGDGEIYDVIDEWLALAMAKWIATQRHPGKAGPKQS